MLTKNPNGLSPKDVSMFSQLAVITGLTESSSTEALVRDISSTESFIKMQKGSFAREGVKHHCQLCGAYLVNFVSFINKQTGIVLYVGEDCAEKLEFLQSDGVLPDNSVIRKNQEKSEKKEYRNAFKTKAERDRFEDWFARELQSESTMLTDEEANEVRYVIKMHRWSSKQAAKWMLDYYLKNAQLDINVFFTYEDCKILKEVCGELPTLCSHEFAERARIVLVNIPDYQMKLRKEVICKAIGRHTVMYVANNLNLPKFKDLDRSDLLLALMEIRGIKEFDLSFNKLGLLKNFGVLDNRVAFKLIELGFIWNFVNNLSSFPNLDRSWLKNLLVNHRYFAILFSKFDEFTLEDALNWIKSGHVHIVASNLLKFNEHNQDLFLAIVKTSYAKYALENKELFTDCNDELIKESLLSDGKHELAVTYYDRFTLELAHKLIVDGYCKLVCDNHYKFEDFTLETLELFAKNSFFPGHEIADDVEGYTIDWMVDCLMKNKSYFLVVEWFNVDVRYALEMIQNKYPEIVLHNLDSFIDIDHVATAYVIVYNGYYEVVIENIEKIKGIDIGILAKYLISEGWIDQVMHSDALVDALPVDEISNMVFDVSPTSLFLHLDKFRVKEQMEMDGVLWGNQDVSVLSPVIPGLGYRIDIKNAYVDEKYTCYRVHIRVPNEKKGLVIGKKGANIKKAGKFLTEYFQLSKPIWLVIVD